MEMRVVRWVVAAAVLAALSGAGQAVLHRPMGAVYDLYLGGIPIGELRIEATVDGGSYAASSAMKTAGVLGAFYDAGYRARVEGTVGPEGLTPQRFVAEGQDGSFVQAVDMRYRDGRPAAVAADPPFKPKPWQIEPGAQRGTVDPVTAALTALAPAPPGRLCNRTVEIFDGRRRYAVDLGRPVADGERIRCEGLYRRVAGYKPKELKETIAFDVWFEERPDGLAHLVRAAGDSGFGIAVALLRQ